MRTPLEKRGSGAQQTAAGPAQPEPLALFAADDSPHANLSLLTGLRAAPHLLQLSLCVCVCVRATPSLQCMWLPVPLKGHLASTSPAWPSPAQPASPSLRQPRLHGLGSRPSADTGRLAKKLFGQGHSLRGAETGQSRQAGLCSGLLSGLRSPFLSSPPTHPGMAEGGVGVP